MFNECILAERYFFRSIHNKVYIERNSKIETFNEYLHHAYRGNCYYYSFDALMGLNSEAFLVRGTLLDRAFFIPFTHGWVEFKYKGSNYVFDSRLTKQHVVLKSEYYEEFNPNITFKETKKEILATFLKKKYAFKISDGFWQFKSVLSIIENLQVIEDRLLYEKVNQENGFLPSTLHQSRVRIEGGQVAIFIACDHS